jgi:hypothetical protein
MDLFHDATDFLTKGKKMVGDAAKAAAHGYADAQRFVSDILHGNVGKQAVPMPEVIQKVVAGSSGTWHEGVIQGRKLADRHAEISTEITAIAADLEAAWTGSAADAAKARIKPFADVTATAAQSFTDNSANLSNLAHSFDSVQAAFRAQPLPSRPDKGFLDVVTPWDTDTEAKINAYNTLVLLDPIPPPGLVEHLLATLPDVPAADVAPTTVPHAQLGNPSGFSNANPLAQLADTGPFDYLTEVLGARRDASHQLYAAVRDKSGERRRSRPLSAIDCPRRADGSFWAAPRAGKPAHSPPHGEGSVQRRKEPGPGPPSSFVFHADGDGSAPGDRSWD